MIQETDWKVKICEDRENTQPSFQPEQRWGGGDLSITPDAALAIVAWGFMVHLAHVTLAGFRLW